MTGEHREQLVEAIRMLMINVEDGSWAGLDVVSVLGARDITTDEVMFAIKVHDPAGRLRNQGIEGLCQYAPGDFSLVKAEAGLLRELQEAQHNPAAHDAWQLALQHLEPLRAAIERARGVGGDDGKR